MKSILSGQPVLFRDGEYIRETCCDCQLQHLTRVRIVGRRIEVTSFRDDYETIQNRKREGIRIQRILKKRENRSRMPAKAPEGSSPKKGLFKALGAVKAAKQALSF